MQSAEANGWKGVSKRKLLDTTAVTAVACTAVVLLTPYPVNTAGSLSVPTGANGAAAVLFIVLYMAAYMCWIIHSGRQKIGRSG